MAQEWMLSLREVVSERMQMMRILTRQLVAADE
jgi:hypothetical protein